MILAASDIDPNVVVAIVGGAVTLLGVVLSGFQTRRDNRSHIQELSGKVDHLAQRMESHIEQSGKANDSVSKRLDRVEERLDRRWFVRR